MFFSLHAATMKSLRVLSIFALSIFVTCGRCQGLYCSKNLSRLHNSVIITFLECGDGAEYKTEGWARQFTCSTDGVSIAFDVPGCACVNFDNWYNLGEKKCMPLSCANMDCVGKANEAFFTFESSSRDNCECTNWITRDAQTRCMCKNGFCRKDGQCVKRDCIHSVYH